MLTASLFKKPNRVGTISSLVGKLLGHVQDLSLVYCSLLYWEAEAEANMDVLFVVVPAYSRRPRCKVCKLLNVPMAVLARHPPVSPGPSLSAG